MIVRNRPLLTSASVMKSARHAMPPPEMASWRIVSPLDAEMVGVIPELPRGVAVSDRSVGGSADSGQSLSVSGAVNPIRRCLSSSATFVGSPRSARYPGAATRRSRLLPSGRACNVESCSVPIRIAISTRCSIKSTTRSLLLSSSTMSGYAAANAFTCGTMQWSMNGDAASTRSLPAGRVRCRAMDSSASSIALRIARARMRKSSPSSVNWRRRVVRRTSVASSFCSRRPSARLTPETVCRSASAAAVIEPLSITVTNAFNSSVVVFTNAWLTLSQGCFHIISVYAKVRDGHTSLIGDVGPGQI